MREIKFRAAVTDNKGNHQRWAYGTPEFGDMGQLYILEGIGGRFLCERDTLGQFTGLKDKNGKEIYEGDVVSYGYGKPHEVIWRKGTFCYQTGVNEFHIFDESQCEIIGNIYENPDLLTS